MNSNIEAQLEQEKKPQERKKIQEHLDRLKLNLADIDKRMREQGITPQDPTKRDYANDPVQEPIQPSQLINENGQLVYKKDSDGNPIISKIKDANGDFINKGRAEARKIMTHAVSDKNQAFVRINVSGRSMAIGPAPINLGINKMNQQIEGAKNVDNRTMGWGMTLMHEILHTNVAEGGPKGHGNEETKFGLTGEVVDRINIIRQELNSQGENYGIRKSYMGLNIGGQTTNYNFVPFGVNSRSQLYGKKAPKAGSLYIILTN